jgi:hypothetical protein
MKTSGAQVTSFRRVSLIVLCALLVLTPASTAVPVLAAAGPQPQAQPQLLGDADGDGLCTEVDALTALQTAVGMLAPDLVLDVDGDGQVTEVDALTILQWAVAGGRCLAGDRDTASDQDDEPLLSPDVHVVAEREVPAAEFQHLLEGDEGLARIHELASQQGYTRKGPAAEVTLSDGTIVAGRALSSSQGQSAVAMRLGTEQEARSFLMRFEPGKMVLETGDGRLELSEHSLAVFDLGGSLISERSVPVAMRPAGLAKMVPQPLLKGPMVLANRVGAESRDASLNLPVAAPPAGCYPTPNWSTEFDECMTGAGISLPIGFAGMVMAAVGACIATLTTPPAVYACVGAVISVLGAAGLLTKCIWRGFDDPPTVGKLTAQVLSDKDKRPETRGGQRGVELVPVYHVVMEIADDRLPLPERSRREMDMTPGGIWKDTAVQDCGGNWAWLGVHVPSASEDPPEWVHTRETLISFPSNKQYFEFDYAYGLPVVKNEWKPCGREGQICCVDAPACDQALRCEQDVCRKDSGQKTEPGKPPPDPDKGLPPDTGSGGTSPQLPGGETEVVDCYLEANNCMCYISDSDGAIRLVNYSLLGVVTPCDGEAPELSPID